jgi:2-C-methyl-D-erythritol 4-phosphate cytidylyltransferase
MAMNTQVDALIFAGGVGRRMRGSDRPKQFLEYGGRPIIAYTIERFMMHPMVDAVTVVCLESWIDYLRNIMGAFRYTKPLVIVPGGASGQESIFNGLKTIHEQHPDDKDAVVLVHDGVRPLIDDETITNSIESAVKRGPTATVAPAIETILLEDEEGKVTEFIDRSRCRLARAPQAVRTEELYSAHLHAREQDKTDFIDSVSMLSYYGADIYTVEGPAENIKVTTPTDYYAFKSFMDMKDVDGLER